MKKLFLYVALFSFVFWAAFIILRDIYSAKTPAYLKEEYGNTEASEKPDAEDLQIEQEADNMPEDAELSERIGLLHQIPSIRNNAQGSYYLVGIKDSYVVVFENGQDGVFEYTGIDAEPIRLLSTELYEQLMNQIRFNNTEELYKFLESLSS